MRDCDHALRDQQDRCAEVFRKLVEQENSVLNLRITWFMTTEGFLFAALGFSWEGGSPLLVLTISIVGVLVALTGFFAVRLSEVAFMNLRECWNKSLQNYDGPPRCGFDLAVDPRWWEPLLPHHAMPWIFIGVWVSVALLRFVKIFNLS